MRHMAIARPKVSKDVESKYGGYGRGLLRRLSSAVHPVRIQSNPAAIMLICRSIIDTTPSHEKES